MADMNILSHELVNFIEELRLKGYNIGIEQFIAVQDLLAALIAQGRLPPKLIQLQTLLSPILCHSPQEQSEFKHHFARWVGQFEKITKIESQTTVLSSEIKQISQKLRFWQWLTGIIVFIMLAIMVIFFVFPPTDIKPEPVPPKPVEKPILDKPSPTVEKPVKPTETPNKPSPIIIYYTEWNIDIILSVLLSISLIGYITYKYQFNRFLARKSSTIPPDIKQFFVQNINTKLFSSISLRHDAQQLRKHITIPIQQLDIQATVAKTIQAGGWFTPVTGSTKRLPEYLVLIDRTSFKDHQAQFVDVLVNRLLDEGIFITRYYFDADPRRFYSEKILTSPLTLLELTERYPEHRLLMFAEASSLLNPISGKLADWITKFEIWSQRILFTVESVEYHKKLLEQANFIIFPANESGLAALADYINTNNSLLKHIQQDFSLFPALLSERPRRFLERHSPNAEKLAELLQQTRYFLGKQGYDWLSACAVYPELNWQLTIYLGHQLHVITEENVVKLARLPWFRHGTMPNWLREKLVTDLSATQERKIREALQLLLAELEVSGKPLQSFDLEVAEKEKRRLLALAKQLLPKWVKQTKKLHDYVFLTVMGNRLAVKVPEKMRSLLVRPVSAMSLFVSVIVLGIGLFFYITHTINDVPSSPPISQPNNPTPTTAQVTEPPTIKPFTVFSDTLQDKSAGPKMIMLPAGKFMMGSNDGYDDEKPVHEVTVKSFAIGKYEVTVGEFKAFVNVTTYKTEAEQGDGCYGWTGENWVQDKKYNWKYLGFTQTDTHPVACVSWNDAVAYTEWLSQQTGRKYRLPTEAEWEYAARAGSQSKWHFGNDENQLENYAWYSKNSGKQTHPVGEKKPNQFGLYDMAGNVWEWTCSDYESYSSSAETICSENSNKNKSLRGGSWDYNAVNCRAAFRNYTSPSLRDYYLGFRLILFSR